MLFLTDIQRRVLGFILARWEAGEATQPSHRNIVATLIDQEVTLKTLVHENGKAWLRSKNPDYPHPIPLQELQIQGIARSVIRPLKP